MNKETLNLHFNAYLNKIIPDRAKLANMLSEILNSDKEYVYRRMRGDVPFSFAETTMICNKFGISIDRMVGIQFEDNYPFTLQTCNFAKPSEADYYMWECYNAMIEYLSSTPYFSILETWTTLPIPLIYNYPAITRFYIYKISFQSIHTEAHIKFNEYKLDERFQELSLICYKYTIKAHQTQLIFSDEIFNNLVKDVLVFRELDLIDDESIRLIYEDLISFWEYLRSLADTGKFPDSEKEVSLYVAGLEIDTNYTLFESNDLCITLLRTLIFNAGFTSDINSFNYMKGWFAGKKRFATNITISGERDRLIFFNKQLKAIEKLKGAFN